MKNLRKGLALFTVCLLVMGMMTGSYPAEIYHATAIQTAEAPALIYPGDSVVLDGGQAGITIDDDGLAEPGMVDGSEWPGWTNRSGMVYRSYAEGVFSESAESVPVPETDADGMPLLDGDGNPVYRYEPSEQVFIRLETVGRIVAVIGGGYAEEDADYSYSLPEGVSWPTEDGTAGNTDAGVYSSDRTIHLYPDQVDGKVFRRWSVYTLDGNLLTQLTADSFSDPVYWNLSPESLGTEDIQGAVPLSVTVGSGPVLVFMPVYADDALPQSFDEGEQTGSGEEVLPDPGGQPDLSGQPDPTSQPDQYSPLDPNGNAFQILNSDEYSSEQVNPLSVQNGYSDQENPAEVPADTTVTVTAYDPPEGQRFVRWDTGGAVIEGLSEEALLSQTISFSMPAAPVALSAVYENVIPVYTITARNASIAMEGVTDHGDGSVSGRAQQGTTVTIAANPAPEGQQFDHWNVVPEWAVTDSVLTDSSINVTVGESDITAEACYAEIVPEIVVRTITVRDATIAAEGVTDNGDGSFSVSVPQGTDVAITANSAPQDQQFDHWSLQPEGAVTASGTTEPSIVVNAGDSDIFAEPVYVPVTPVRTIRVVNAAIENVPVSFNEDGSLSASVEQGTVVRLAANSAPEGQRFDCWNLTPEGALASSGTTDSVIDVAVGESDITAEACYAAAEPEIPVRKLRVLNATVKDEPVVFNEDGSLTADVEEGKAVLLTANPAPEGEQFDHWQLNPEEVLTDSDVKDPVITVTVGGSDITAEAVNMTVEPEIPLRTLKVMNAVVENVPAVGNEDGSSSVTVEDGTKVVVTANEAPEGQQFEQWKVSSQSEVATSGITEPTLEVTVSADDVAVEPVYVQVQEEPVLQAPQITVEQPSDGGTIDLAESRDVDGTTVQYTYVLTPSSGYQVDSFTATVGDTVLETSSLSEDRTTLTFTAEKGVDPEMVFVTASLDAGAYTLTVNSGSGSGTYSLGEQVPIAANAPDAGWRFTRWTVSGNGVIADETAAQTTFTIADTDAQVTANYEQIPYNLTVQSGSGTGTHFNGDQVVITADPPKSGYRFRNWSLTSGNGSITSDASSQTTFIMTTSDAVVTANYELIPYTLSVKNGSGSGTYTKGTTVNITPNFPASGKEFDRWEKTSGKVKFDNLESYYATITMRANDTIVTALYKNGPDPNNNTITGLENGAEYLKSTTLTFTAAGAGMENGNPNPGDYRYRPASYQIGSVGGSWTSSPYTTSMAINAVGDYTLTVTYAKDVYDGSNWNPDGTNVTKSITFHVVNALSVKTGDSSPLIPLALAGGAALIVIIILIVVLRRRRK